MGTKSMAFREIGPVFVEVHSGQAPTDADWAAFIAAARKALSQGCKRVLVVTDGGTPNAKQRVVLNDLAREFSVTVAVLSDAPATRGVVTVLSWFNPLIRSFAFKDGSGIYDALKHLKVEGFLAARLLLELREMQRELAA
jgi:hypothetical protein